MLRVWLIDLDSGAIPDVTVLEETERRRAAALIPEPQRRRYVAAHVALRELLAQEIGCVPRAVRIRRAPCAACGELHGKPYVEGGPHVSLSRSGRWAAVALGDRELGVDLEELQVAARLDGLRDQVLAPDESSTDLLTTWVRKEALLKATGEGLTRSMTTIRADHRVIDLELPPGLVGALAFTDGIPERTRVQLR